MYVLTVYLLIKQNLQMSSSLIRRARGKPVRTEKEINQLPEWENAHQSHMITHIIGT